MKIEGKNYKTIWFDQNTKNVKIIDQTKLPHQFIIKDLETVDDAINAIKVMEVRGAPLIGATAAFGIVLMTPDDFGRAADESEENPRARQNVIFEMGMLYSSLGRDKCAILMKGGIELPSDIEGVIRYDFDNSVKEVGLKLIQDLKNAGFSIDDSKIASAVA